MRLNIPCDYSLSCPSPSGFDDDFPVQNWTSEQPDRLLFIGQNWGWGDEDPALGTNWSHNWCYGVCYSDVSQHEADLCAAANQYLCMRTPPGNPQTGDGGGGPPVVPGVPPPGPEQQVYFSAATSCSLPCPDGTNQTYTVPSGKFVANSQIMANRMAQSECEQQIAFHLVCLGEMTAWWCVNTLGAEATITVSRAPSPPYHFTVSSGLIPTGMSLIDETPNTAVLYGTPTEAGTFTFTIKATGANGDSGVKQYTVHVFGIKNLDLISEATIGTAYSFQLVADGAVGTTTFSVAPGYSLPAGLTLTAAGLISGNPGGPAESRLVKFVIEDSAGGSCMFDATMTVNAAPPVGPDWSLLSWPVPSEFLAGGGTATFMPSPPAQQSWFLVQVTAPNPGDSAIVLVNYTAILTGYNGPASQNHLHVDVTNTNGGFSYVTVQWWNGGAWVNLLWQADIANPSGSYDYDFVVPDSTAAPRDIRIQLQAIADYSTFSASSDLLVGGEFLNGHS